MHDPLASLRASATLRVAVFAGMAELAGGRTLEVPWEGGTVGDLRRAIAATHPQLEPLLARSAVARGTSYVPDDARLAIGDDVAVIPPVSGG
jgi:molybdopterin converting factor small subunit